MSKSPCSVLALVVLTALFVTGCARPDRVEADLVHVVVCWLKEPGDPEAIDRMTRASLELRSIPGVHDLEVGAPVASARPMVDDSYDVAVIMRFEDEAALDRYLVHPDHQRAVREILEPLADRVVIYDVRVGRNPDKTD